MTVQTPSPEVILSLASQLADVAAEQTLKWFRAPALVTQNKWAEGFDPVTEADRAAEAAMRALLKVQRPEDSSLARKLKIQSAHLAYPGCLIQLMAPAVMSAGHRPGAR